MQRGGKNSSSRRCLARRETLSFESGTRRREGRKGKKRRIESGLFKACFAGFQWRPFFERVPDYIRTFERGFGWWSLPLLKSYLFRRKRKGRPARWRGGEEGVEIGVRTAAWRLTNWTRGWILGYRAVKKKKRKKKNVTFNSVVLTICHASDHEKIHTYIYVFVSRIKQIPIHVNLHAIAIHKLINCLRVNENDEPQSTTTDPSMAT